VLVVQKLKVPRTGLGRFRHRPSFPRFSIFALFLVPRQARQAVSVALLLHPLPRGTPLFSFAQ
jgi:hypothetical protein